MKRYEDLVVRWWLVFLACMAPLLLTPLLVPLAMPAARPLDWAWLIFLAPVALALSLLTLALWGSSLLMIALAWLFYTVIFAYPLWWFWMQLAWLLI